MISQRKWANIKSVNDYINICENTFVDGPVHPQQSKPQMEMPTN